MMICCRHWRRWLQWKQEYVKGNGTDNPAAEMAVYLTYLAYSSGGWAA